MLLIKSLIHRICFLLNFIYCLLPNPILSAEKLMVGTTAIQEKIMFIDPMDRQKLEIFFRNLFSNGDFAYTLFGDKPLGSIDLFFNGEFLNKQIVVHFVGWQIWKKYQHLFTSNQYCLGHYDRIATISFFGFMIVNKNKCREIINQHLPLFKSCFNICKVDDFIEELCSQDFYSIKMEDRQKNFYLCLGLLFGYGEKSASFFERRMELIRTIAQYPYSLNGLNESDLESVYYLDKTKINGSACHIPIQDLINELNDLESKKTYTFMTTKNNPFYPIKIKGFIQYEYDPEIEVIQEKNDALQEKLLKIYYSENFLECILEKLSS